MTANHDEVQRWMVRTLAWEQTLARLRGKVPGRVVPVRPDRHDDAAEPREPARMRNDPQERASRHSNRVA